MGISFSRRVLLRVTCALALLGLPAITPTAHAEAMRELEQAAEHLGAGLKHGVENMQPLVEQYGYAGVAGAVTAEGMGLPAPGQTLLMAAALEAARGGHLNIVLLGAIALLAAVLGNSLGYLVGRAGGRPLLRKLGANAAREENLVALFQRFGGGFVMLARFLDGPRQLNGILAGVLEMRWWTFTLFNVLGALLWVGIWGLGTYYLWEHVGTVHTFLTRINPWVAGAVAVGLVAALGYLFRGRRRGLN